MNKQLASGAVLTLLFAVVLAVPFNILSVKTGVCTADYCWVGGESLDIGFSKYGEMISYDDATGKGVGLQYPGYATVGTHDQTEGTSRDPFAHEGIPVKYWLNGWLLEARYTHRIFHDRRILATAMFGDMSDFGGDWIVGKELPLMAAPYGGRKTTGYAETDDIQVLYDDPRFFKALCTTHIYDWEDNNEDEVVDHPTETWPVVDVMITIIFDKAKKAVTVQKDVILVIDAKILDSPVDCQFSTRGQWDMGPLPDLDSYAHFYHQRNLIGFGNLWDMAPGIVREFRVSMIGPTDPPRTVVLPSGNLEWYGYPVVHRSERVYVNGVWQVPGEDYWPDYDSGVLSFWYDLDSEDEIVAHYKLPKYYEDGGWHWDGWEGIPNCYDLAQMIGSDEEYVGFAAFWPTLSDYTVDGWANVFNPLLNVSQPDMSPPGSEPDIPFLAGEWDFMLDYVDPWSPEFRGVTAYGLADLTDGDDRDIGPDHEDAVDSEFVFDPLFNPVAGFTYAPEKPIVHQEVAFNSTAFDIDGDIVGWEWDFNTDSVIDATAENATWTYTEARNYTVTLNVTDNHGLWDTESQNITVHAPPVANFTYSPSDPKVDETVTFNASASYDPDGTIVSYEWDFGDGAADTGMVVPHTYSTGGVHPVALTVTDDTGLTDTAIANVTVRHRILTIQLSGEHDYLQMENVKIRVAALVTDAETMDPVSGANVTIEIYGPAGTPWISDNMTERLLGTGIYEWNSTKTIRELMARGPLSKGVYLVHAQASYGGGPIAADILQFHIDPPVEAPIQLPTILLLLLTGALATVISIWYIDHRRLTRKRNALERPA